MPVDAPTALAPTPVERPRGFRTGVRRALDHPQAALITILTCQLMVVLDATIVNIALPKIQSSLSFSSADLSWVLNAYTLTFGGLLLLGARIGDVWGRRKTFLTGIALFTAASLAGGLAQNEGMLLTARAVQGIGGALASPAALALLMTTFAGVRERSRALGLYTAVSIGGSAVGLILGGLLVQWASWRWVMFVNVPVGIALLAVGRGSLPETPGRAGRFDLTGAVTSTAGITALVFGFVRVAEHSWGDHLALGAFGLAVVLLAVFIAVESRVASPITPLRLFNDRNRNAANVARLLLIGGMTGVFFFLSQFLQDTFEYSALLTGVAFLPLTVVVFASSQITARRLVEKIGPKTLMIAGLVCSASGLFWLSFLSPHDGYLDLLGPLLLFGLGNGTAFVPLTTAALFGIAPEDSSAASGLLNVTQQVGGSLGLALLVTVFGTTSRHATGPAGASAVEHAHHVFAVGADSAFRYAAGFVLLAVVLTAVAIRRIPLVGD